MHCSNHAEEMVRIREPQLSRFRAAVSFKHVERMNGDGYSILDSFAEYKPEPVVSDATARRSFKLPMETFWALHDCILGTLLEERTSTKNADGNLKTQMINSENTALDKVEARVEETRYTNYNKLLKETLHGMLFKWMGKREQHWMHGRIGWTAYFTDFDKGDRLKTSVPNIGGWCLLTWASYKPPVGNKDVRVCKRALSGYSLLSRIGKMKRVPCL